MIPLSKIFNGGGLLINELIKKEWVDQGHHLTGNFEATIHFINGVDSMAGYAPGYAMVLERGIPAARVDERIYLGPLIRYFKQRGLDDANAGRAAYFTIEKWKREGMPTQASSRFSTTGQRKNFIKTAMSNPDIDDYFLSTFDLSVDDEFKKTKNETI